MSWTRRQVRYLMIDGAIIYGFVSHLDEACFMKEDTSFDSQLRIFSVTPNSFSPVHLLVFHTTHHTSQAQSLLP